MAGRPPGPPKQPAKLRLLHGEHRPSQVNYNEPQPRAAPLETPEDLGETARAVWQEAVRELDAMGLAHAADRDALRCYCEAVVTHRRASQLLEKSDLLIRGQKGNLVRNPVLQIQRDAATVIRNFANEFGLTPASRARIEVKGENDDDDNPFAVGLG